MTRRRVDELIQEIASLPQADQRRVIAELTKGNRTRRSGGGRQPLTETVPAAVKLAKRLHRRGLSLRAISSDLAKVGHVNERGQPYSAQSVRAMLGGPQKRKRL